MRDRVERLRIGVRRSPMALCFARKVERAILSALPSLSVEVGTYVSEADRIKGSLAPYGGKGTFVKDLEKRLLEREIDVAVHALKDMPSDAPMHGDLVAGAYLPRQDPRDCLILRTGLSEESLNRSETIIGTSAPRRRAILRKLWPEARPMLVRGNVDTRLEKLENGPFHALILAASGFDLLQMEDRIHRRLSIEEAMPAIGQGVVCLQVRREDLQRFSFLAAVNDPDTTYCITAERQVVLVLKGNCHSSIAGLCKLDRGEGKAWLKAIVFEPGGGAQVTAESMQLLDCADPVQLGQSVGEALLAQGAARFLSEAAESLRP